MSPLRSGPWQRIEDAPASERQRGDQCHWYEFLRPHVRGLSVLDVGAGSGYGARLMSLDAAVVDAIDPAPVGEGVSQLSIHGLGSGQYDVVVACDVIEHVEADEDFLAQLLRVAREMVFISTPNWDVSRCANPFHVREYTPGELARLLRWYRCEWFTSNNDRKIVRIEHPRLADDNFGVIVRCAR